MMTLDKSYVVSPEVWRRATDEAKRNGFPIFNSLVSKEGQASFQYIPSFIVPSHCTIAIPWDDFMIITAANLLNPPETIAATPTQFEKKVQQFKNSGLSNSEAVKLALNEPWLYQDHLIAKGVVNPPRPNDEDLRGPHCRDQDP